MRRRNSRACEEHGRSVCVFAKLVVIGHGRVGTRPVEVSSVEKTKVWR